MELSEFLVKAKTRTYAHQGEAGETTLADGSKQFTFTEGGWEYRDHFRGSESFLGEEIVLKEGKAIWGMNYYGYLISIPASSTKVYEFLRESLMKVPLDAPYRGPGHFQQESWTYQNDYKGSIKKFEGTETIQLNNQKVFQLFYHGGNIE